MRGVPIGDRSDLAPAYLRTLATRQMDELFRLVFTGVGFAVVAVPLRYAASYTGRCRHGYAGEILVAWTCLYLFSSAVYSRWFYFLEWVPAGDWRDILFDGPPARWVLLAAGMAVAGLFIKKKQVAWLFLVLLIAAQCRCVYEFMSETQGAVLYRDDHPAFMFRLWALREIVPRFTCYNPYWNGGYIDSAIVASGTVSIGSILYPLWK